MFSFFADFLSTFKKHLLGSVIASILLNAMEFGSFAQSTLPDVRLDDTKYQALVERMQPPGISDPFISPIDSAMQSKDWGRARSLCKELIAKPITSFASTFYAFRLKASAHYFMYHIMLENGASYVPAIREQIAAIHDGSRDAAQEFSLHLLQGDDPRVRPAVANLSAQELESVLRTGAELGDEYSEAALGIANVVGSMSNDERLYWALLTVIRDKTKTRQERRDIIAPLIQKVGIQRVTDILKQYSVVGGSLQKSDVGLPPRGVLETLFVDGDLRGTYGLAKATVVPAGMKTPLAPTVRENFDFYSRIIPEVGFGDAYALVPSTGTPSEQRMFFMEKQKIISELEPGDRVFVSCGAFSHVAILYRRDHESRTLLFIDPLYEFWEPQINACVTKFELVPDRNQRFLSAIPEDDVAEMVQAVITVRNSQ